MTLKQLYRCNEWAINLINYIDCSFAAAEYRGPFFFQLKLYPFFEATVSTAEIDSFKYLKAGNYSKIKN